MITFARHRQFTGLVFAAILGSTAAMAGTPLGDLTPLSANFNDKTPDQPINTGGAASGEPLSLGFLDTLIVEAVPGENFLPFLP